MKEMLVRRLLGAGCVALTLFAFSCSDNGELENGGLLPNESHRAKPKLEIGDASSLVVMKDNSNTGGRVAEESSNLYKVTTDGTFEEVVFVNSDNTPIDPAKTQTSISVRNIYELSKKYIVLVGEFTAWDTLGNVQQYYSLLVNKVDGAVYDFPVGSYAPSFEDDAGNIYFRNFDQMVVQIDVSDPLQVKQRNYLPTGQVASRFEVDKEGNVIYETNMARQYRLRKKNGGIYEIDFKEILPEGAPGFPDLNYGNQGAWVGINGKLYFETYDWRSGTGARSHFHTISVDEQNKVVIDTVWTGSWAAINAIGHGSSTNMMKIYKEKSILFVAPNRAWEFFEETNSLNEVILPEIPSFDDVFHSDSHLYYRSGMDVYKISLSDYSYSKLSLPQGDQFEIYSMNAGINGTVQLSALRFSDGKKIFAQFDSDGVFSIIDEELDREAIVLQRLN